MTALELQGQAAKAAARKLAIAGSADKNRALLAIADALEDRQEEILAANAQDCENAKKNGISPSLLDRLTLNPARIRAMADGVREVAALADPVGTVTEMVTRPNGLMIGKKTVPLGVIGIIYEARPNVTVDAAALCLKAGNAVILRGGKEAFQSNNTLTNIMRETLQQCTVYADAVQLVQSTERESATELMQLTGYLDVLIPRGGKGLIESVSRNAKVPVIVTGWGNCHVYIDDTADLQMGANIIENAKCSRPSVCNAAETLLVARSVAKNFLPLAKAQLDTYSCEIRGCSETCSILPDAIPATDEDWDTEYGNYTLAVKVVSGLDEALEHIAAHSSGHSECIVTESYANAQRFLNEVDSAAVYVNASTRFTDGGEFGLGAEIGISTQKLHARGPMGLEELTSYKYLIYGAGQIR
ncbi:MAG: glutamate-5-semialdehyde dehydrogenase [Ruminococcaceae bacterium]|nr:glutamate-5-semialdehyde dehydrogenase [Oscillospiraceae bacterium]